MVDVGFRHMSCRQYHSTSDDLISPHWRIVLANVDLFQLVDAWGHLNDLIGMKFSDHDQ